MGAGIVLGRGRGAFRARPGLVVLLTAVAAATVLQATAARSQSVPVSSSGAPTATRNYSIPAGSLAQALNRFAEASRLQLIYSSETTRGLSTGGLNGAYTPREAIARLLSGSGLTHRFTGRSNVTIERPGTPLASDRTPDGAILLGQIDVSADGGAGSGFLGTPDWVYQTPGSVSVISREAIQQAGARNTRDLLNLSAGVYSGEGQGSFPTVSPNIRGVQDSGRVVVSIDGARQNAQDGGRYGGSGLANFGGAFVDSAFIREIDINKNPTAAAGNAGSLGGTVNFRTVGAQDIIKAGKTWGIELDATRGTNQHNFQGSLLTAFRFNEHLALTTGVSRLSLGKYKPGENGTGGGTFGLTNRDALSTLVKIEGDFGDLKTSVSWMRQLNDYAYTPSGNNDDGWKNGFKARNDSAVADFSWDPASPLIGLKGKLWLNSSIVDETRDARTIGGATFSPETSIDKRLTSFGGTLENTSALQTNAGPLTLNYGVEAFRDRGDKSATSDTIAQNPLYASSYGAFSPAGNRDVASLFLNGKWEPASWMNVSAGMRYDWTRLHGTAKYYSRETRTETITVPCDAISNHYTAADYYSQAFLPAQTSNQAFWASPAGQTLFLNVIWPTQIANGCMPGTGTSQTNTIVSNPEHALDIDRSYGAWLPSVTVEFTPVDWFKPYVSYSHSFRPPTITEAFIGGGLAPSDAVGMNLAPNANLRPETARTWELGFNVLRNGLFTGRDRLRIKAAVFHREIDDFIVMGYTQTAQVAGWEYNSFVNAADKTTMRGIELEGNYDAGAFWLGGSATWLKTEWPEKTEVFNNGSAVIDRCMEYGCGTTTSGTIYAVAGNVPPRQKFTIDAGLRFFDRKLSVGARLNQVKPTLSRVLDDQGNLTEITEPYTTLDIYTSLRLGDTATLRLAVNNVADVNYVPGSANYSAPGRTFLMGPNLKPP
ncbi:MAG: TonB-dependent hemoglobin/transferrin/lactoferrin family receptor [Pseudolabrys sp.]|nr:TonB-dependent hemoglobin/transferrin/lactoferrin family receptor [Pseudolabrys sp.]